MSDVIITLPPALSAVLVTLPDGSVLTPATALARPPIVIRLPSTSAADAVLPARGDYPAATLVGRIYDLQDRKAEQTELELPDLTLIFENQLQ